VSQTPQKLAGSRAYQEGWRAINLLIRSDGSWSGRERDVCYRNLGDGRFEEESFLTGLDSAGDGRAFATLDLNGDGALDLALVSRTAPRLQLWRNQPAARRSLLLELRGSGEKSNRDAIGAVAELTTNRGRKLLRIVQAGAGYLSQSSRRLHFALEPGEQADLLTIVWPGGDRQTLRATPSSGLLRLTEGRTALEPIAAGPIHRVGNSEPAPGTLWLVEPVQAPALAGLPRGKRLLVSFWASWCPPCKQEMAEWKSAAQRLRSAGLEVVVASVDDDKTRKPDAPFAMLYPTPRQIAAWNLFHRHLFDRRQDIGLPMSFLLDEQGRVLKVYKGVTPSAAILADLAAKIRPALPFAGKWFGQGLQRNYVDLATALAEHGLGAESVVYFEAALAQGNSTAELLNNYAGVLLENGDLEGAEALLLRTLSQYPRQSDALANLGTLRLRQGQAGAAREVFKQVLAGQPDDAFALNGLGSALFAETDLAPAREAFEKAVLLRPENTDYRYNLASVLAARGEFSAALKEFEAVREARPESPELANNLGVLYVETGAFGQGEAEFQRAIARAPKDEGGYLNLAMLLARLGKKTEALDVLRKLLLVQPGHPRALRMMDGLR